MHFTLIFLVIFSTYSFAKEERLLFTESSFGSIELRHGMEISLYQLSQKFPGYKVTQRIGHGDSPDYHSFSVSDWEGNEVVEFISYIDEKNGYEGYEKTKVKLDEVITCNKNVVDSFGISPGTSFIEAYKSRNNLTYGDGHMDNFLGHGKLWYIFEVPNDDFTRGSLNMAKKVNPEIQCISWPYARWL